jgi:hypothetical protein
MVMAAAVVYCGYTVDIYFTGSRVNLAFVHSRYYRLLLRRFPYGQPFDFSQAFLQDKIDFSQLQMKRPVLLLRTLAGPWNDNKMGRTGHAPRTQTRPNAFISVIKETQSGRTV